MVFAQEVSGRQGGLKGGARETPLPICNGVSLSAALPNFYFAVYAIYHVAVQPRLTC
jgi:hypothetical protein